MTSSDLSYEYSAGGVVYRRNNEHWEFVAVHRARHTDWSLPKGHIEEGESREQAAVREVREETGLDARIVRPLGQVVYFYRRPVRGLTKKTVYHFLLEPLGEELGGPNWEVSEVRWVPFSQAQGILSYRNDLDILAKARAALEPQPDAGRGPEARE